MGFGHKDQFACSFNPNKEHSGIL